jgi:hypothetical protein
MKLIQIKDRFHNYDPEGRSVFGHKHKLETHTRSGNPRCRAEVMQGFHSAQCQNRAKYDGATRCWNHSTDRQRKDAEKMEAKMAANRAKWDHADAVREWNKTVHEALEAIADGHNDPRGFAQEIMSKKPKPPEAT